jgi:hypothetical protein
VQAGSDLPDQVGGGHYQREVLEEFGEHLS